MASVFCAAKDKPLPGVRPFTAGQGDLLYARNNLSIPASSWSLFEGPDFDIFRDALAESSTTKLETPQHAPLPLEPKVEPSPPVFETVTIDLAPSDKKPSLVSKLNSRKEALEESLRTSLAQLNPGQRTAYDQIIQWLESSDPDRSWSTVLSGYAGTGKSFLTKVILLKAELLGFDVIATAPTHKAAGVLQNASGFAASTLHSAFGMKMIPDPDNPEYQILSPANEDVLRRFGPRTLILVDEAFMLGIALFNPVSFVGEDRGVPMLLVGDPAQLNPIGEDFSPVEQCQGLHVSLTEVVRHGGPILELATAAREAQETLRAPEYWPRGFDTEKNEGVIVYDSMRSFYEALYQRYYEIAGEGTWEKIRALAWRRKRVAHMNDQIRSVLGFQPGTLEPGELLSLVDPVVKNDNRRKSIVMHPDEDFIVTSVRRTTIALPPEALELGMNEIDCYLVPCRDQTLRIPVNESDLEGFLSHLGNCARKAKSKKKFLSGGEPWDMFWEWKQKFHRVRSAFGITVHRAQGSGYEEIWIDAHDILCNPNREEAFRCLYTALTRATKRVHVRF